MEREALFIVDNSKDESDSKWNGLEYLVQWCEISRKFDIATGYFDISSLLALNGKWQQLDEIRILMGDEVSFRTKDSLSKALKKITDFLDESIERDKEKNLFLVGVNAIIEGIKTGKIKCRIYNKKKFHAKAYITYSKALVAPPVALVGSSNFTYSGLTQNLELNVRISSEAEVAILQAWYEKYWEEAEDVSEDIISVIEKHIREYTPYEIYIKSLHEYYKGHEVTTSEWEQNHSRLYQEISLYQKEAYHALVKISNQWNGAFLCDGVGLGKTFVGLMLLERLVVHERKRVVLLVPKSGRNAVWEENIRTYLPDMLNNPYVSLRIYNHTDLLRGETRDRNWEEEFEHIKRSADAFIIDEAHNFRNRSSNRYKKLLELMSGGKKLYLLTATPINNSLYDLKNQIDLFTQRDDHFFAKAPIGINSLNGFFIKKEKELFKSMLGSAQDEITAEETREIINSEELFKNIIVQRSRAYVKKSLALENSGRKIEFPVREKPQVANYSLRKVYGTLLDKVEKAFDPEKPLLRLPVYSLYDKDRNGKFIYFIGDPSMLNEMDVGRSLQIVALIRVLLLKRLESSVVAFRETCENLLLKLVSFIELHDDDAGSRWMSQNEDLIKQIKSNRNIVDSEETEEDTLPDELKVIWDKLDGTVFNIPKIVRDTLLDLEELTDFLEDLENFDFSKDDKVQALLRLLNSDADLKNEKVIIFTEFMSTARYLERTLKQNNLIDVLEIDSGYKGERGNVIKQFAPYYNNSSVAKLKENGLSDIRILIATDVLSEGINLQDARLLINYDLHWNPVRLMQRIGRVDRRLNPKIEVEIKRQYPQFAFKRGVVRYWNFLPPAELNELLSLYNRVTSKTLRISKVFGIEGKQLLTAEDDYDALKDFEHAYEGETSKSEEIKLKYQKLLLEDASLEKKLNGFPLKVFSGKVAPSVIKGVFFCYRLPIFLQSSDGSSKWTLEEGLTTWYFYSLEKEEIFQDFNRIHEIVSCNPGEKRVVQFDQKNLVEIKKQIEKQIKNSYYKDNQIPAFDEEEKPLKPILLSWMEVN